MAKQIQSIVKSLRSILGWPVVTMIVLIALKTLCENVPKVEELEEKTYKALLHQIVAIGTKRPPKVLVIDIGEINPERWERDGRSDIVTPRERLEELIQIFADLGARSIGIDVDFSPENGHFAHPDDPDFFGRWLALSRKTKVPIFLGVFRTFNQPNKWLGDDAYRHLAAAIAIRNIIDHDQMPHWIWVEGGDRLGSMSAALAGVEVNAPDIEESRWGWARKSTSIIRLASGIASKETTIDYSPLPWLEAEVLPVLKADAYAKMKDKIQDRMIILGDRKPAESDMFDTSAGRIPGVYVHACAANTIATEPLYRLTLWGRLALDLLLAVAVFLFVRIALLVRSLFKRSPAHAENSLNVIFTFLVIIFVLLASVVFVNRTRLLWTDFVLVCLVLVVQLAVDIFRSRLSSLRHTKRARKLQSNPL